jgi:hypothetical protein
MHRNRSASAHQFSMIPRAEIPRSKFNAQKTLKTAFDSGYLVPIFVDEVLPGDSVNLKMTAFTRLATPLFPVMDNMYLDTFFFFVPNRLVWSNWQRFMGERDPDPDSSIDYTIPQMVSPNGGYAVNSLQDYMGVTASNRLILASGGESEANQLYADLSTATAATINSIRNSFQVQRLLERDSRGGTRYTEIVRSHFGVVSPDARLQRPEYLGGGSAPIIVNPVAQQSASGASGTDTPLGTLGAVGTGLANGHGFASSFTEHGIIIGLCSVRADLTYQQGLHRKWSRETRYDFYFPVFAHLGEQAIFNKEIYATGTSTDDDVFGYQERWAEYRYKPSEVTGLMRSTASGTLDAWHLAQNFGSLPTLNSTFIEDTPPVERIVAVGSEANGQQFIFDSFFDIDMARPMPMYSVPGLVDHF